MQVIRRKLKEQGINESWSTLREKLNGQLWISATFKQRDGKLCNFTIKQAAKPIEAFV